MKKSIKVEIAIGLICLIGMMVMLAVQGCSQRIAEYNPETGVWRYKSNSFATDSSADRITVRTPSGLEVAIEKAMQNNDSITLRVNKLTGQIEVVTEGE